MSDEKTALRVPGYATAVSKIMAAVGTVGKTGTNKSQSYSYATIADVLTKVQPLMAEHGLIIVQSEDGDVEIICDGSILKIKYKFNLIGPDGIWSSPLYQTGMSSFAMRNGWDDKAANKCHTAARKYFEIGLFQIPTADIADADKEDVAPQRSTPEPKTLPTVPIALEPPVDPDTGEVSPHTIKVTGTLIEWGALLAAAINHSQTLDDMNRWIAINQNQINDIRDSNARLHARIVTIIDDKARLFHIEASDSVDSVVTALDNEMKLARTKKGVDIIWKNNEQAIGALQGVEADAALNVLQSHTARVSKAK